MKTIQFITYYSNNNSIVKRSSNLPGEEVINYLIKTLIELNFKVEIISLSSIVNNKNKFYKSYKEKINDNFEIIYIPCFASYNKVVKIINYVMQNLWIIYYYLFKIKKKNIIMIYHALEFMNIINFLKKIKKLKIFMICEELYSVIAENKKRLPSIEKEKTYLSKFDTYLFPTMELNNIVNTNKKPYIILPGVFTNEKIYNEKFEDNKIHVVYAGNFDKNKGVELAIKTGKYLSNNYILHILGFGSKKDTEDTIELINKTNEISNAKIIYDGVLVGEEFTRFLQKCHIGLSTQTSEIKYNNSNFPSKILKYMANGLRVVTVDIPVVKKSIIGKYLYYYNVNDPKEIAMEIEKINFDDKYNSMEIIKKLHKDKELELNKILLNM